MYRVDRGAQSGALKILKRRFWSGARYGRFRSEIEAMHSCADIAGVLPVLDFNCPDQPSDSDPPWLVTGLAEPMRAALGSRPQLRNVVEACLEIAETLAKMHDRGTSHRDIKPENLFRFNGRFSVGDFGLVDFPGKESVTADGGSLGPVYYIAPEMLNEARRSDGRPADVFSLAKTLWVLAADQHYPLPGPLRSTEDATRLSTYSSDLFAALLNRPLERATQSDPSVRPSMGEFASELRAWLTRPDPVAGADAFDAVEFAASIATLNERHHVQQRLTKESDARMATDGLRLRELIRPTATKILDAMKSANFVEPNLSIDNVGWGFFCHGNVRAAQWNGDVTLKADLRIEIPQDPNVPIRATAEYQVELNRPSKLSREVLWSAVAVFPAGGSIEQSEMAGLLDSMAVNFRPAVRRVIELASQQTQDR